MQMKDDPEVDVVILTGQEISLSLPDQCSENV